MLLIFNFISHRNSTSIQQKNNNFPLLNKIVQWTIVKKNVEKRLFVHFFFILFSIFIVKLMCIVQLFRLLLFFTIIQHIELKQYQAYCRLKLNLKFLLNQLLCIYIFRFKSLKIISIQVFDFISYQCYNAICFQNSFAWLFRKVKPLLTLLFPHISKT